MTSICIHKLKFHPSFRVWCWMSVGIFPAPKKSSFRIRLISRIATHDSFLSRLIVYFPMPNWAYVTVWMTNSLETKCQAWLAESLGKLLKTRSQANLTTDDYASRLEDLTLFIFNQVIYSRLKGMRDENFTTSQTEKNSERKQASKTTTSTTDEKERSQKRNVELRLGAKENRKISSSVVWNV